MPTVHHGKLIPAMLPRRKLSDQIPVMNRRTLHPWRLAVVFVGLASLAACGPPLEWYKEGVTPSQYAVDLRYCKGAEDLVASYTPDDLMYSLPLDEIETYNACMYERGYRLIEAGQPAPGR